MTQLTTQVKGGAWLLEPSDAASVFTPEKLNEEHRLIRQTADELVEQEVLPVIDRLEQKDWPLSRQLLRRAGELGLLGVDAPEAYGGVDLDKVSSLIVSERLARSASFGATFGAQANLTVLPILLFATDYQKRRYLSRLVTGEIVGAYSLSESGSGSDALGARTRATKEPDGGFVLNGEKMWTTNGGFADVFIVFAKVDGQQFTAFIVERAFAGLSSGKEEHKMGLHGSSTTAVVLQDVRVPAENLLGEVGKGHKVAFNVLNFGRLKLGAMCGGGCMAAIGEAARYAARRKQFGQPIASFGAIKQKLAQMTVRTYAVQSLLYRTAGLLDAAIKAGAAFARSASAPEGERREAGENSAAAMLAAAEELAVEASIAKVTGSETLDFVLDENIQIHGGNGFVKDYPAERHYRDARVNRIFEGTNEINRLLIPTLLVRRAVKGELDLLAAARTLLDRIGHSSDTDPQDDLADSLTGSERTVVGLKQASLLVFGAAMKRYGEQLPNEQEILLYLADIMMDIYAAESAVLRARLAKDLRLAEADLHVDAARLFASDAAGRVELAARQALAAMSDGEKVGHQLAALRRLLQIAPIDTVAIGRRLAVATTERGGYLFE
jgi:alkylation response protein AidB-like acyl-CoA dehydrogenase